MLRIALICLFASATAQAQDRLGASFSSTVRPRLEALCIDCHEGTEGEGGVDLTSLWKNPAPVDALMLVRRMRDKLESGEMPPRDELEIEEWERKELLAWARGALLRGVDRIPWHPGRVTVRRLSRDQWRRSVRDLLGVASDLTQTFPTDDLGYGFDTIGDALSFSALHLERYLEAAEDVALRAFDAVDPANPRQSPLAVEAAVNASGGVRTGAGGARFYSNGTVTWRLSLPRAGRYRLRLRAWGDQAGGAPPLMVVGVDGKKRHTFKVSANRGEPAEYEVELELGADCRRLSISFTNDWYQPSNPPENRDRNLIVEEGIVVGPIDRFVPPAGAQWLHDLDPGVGMPAVRARPVIAELVRRAWRRPPQRVEVGRLCDLVEAAVEGGGSFGEGMQHAVAAVLTSPHFLFRWEVGEGPALPAHALAVRLSYFLWGNLPDAALRELADSGRLTDRRVLRAEVERMLADPRADVLARDFVGQWLELRRLAAVEPDPERFPRIDDALRRSMRRETELLFLEVLHKSLDVRRLLDADHTWVDSRVARHYGIEGPDGDEFVRVALPEGRRAGVLAHASVLTVTSNPTRTSPVKRGKWILENLLDAPPPPPPPEAGNFTESDKALSTSAGMRERLAAHRDRANCASCHTRMDALGFALENFDAVGRFRLEDEAGAIDARGELPDGRTVAGAEELCRVLSEGETFVRCLLRKLFIHAVGRDASPLDLLHLEAAVARLDQEKITMGDLIWIVVGSDPFRGRAVKK